MRTQKKLDPIEEALMKAKQIKAAANENALSFLEKKVLKNPVNNRIVESIFREEEDLPVDDTEIEDDDTVSEEELDQFLLDQDPVEESYFFEEDEDDLDVEDEPVDSEEDELEEDYFGDDMETDDFSDDEFLAGEDDSFVDDMGTDDMTLYGTDLDDEPFLDDVEDPLDSSFDDDVYEEDETEDDEEDFVFEEDETEDEPESETDDEEEKETMDENQMRRTRRENRILRRKVAQLEKANKIMNSSINEVSLYNSKLAFSARLFNKHTNLTLEQKKRVMKQFSKAKSVNEVKAIFKALNEGIPKYRKQKSLKESKRRVSNVNPFKATPMLKKDQPKSNENMIIEKTSNKYARLAGIRD